MTHKQWLDNEYSQWIKALQESTVHNFKEHPMVKRMLGEPDSNIWGPDTYHPEVMKEFSTLFKKEFNITHRIDQIGYDPWKTEHDNFSRLNRYIYYAQQILKRNPSSICEIGGGVGQFMAILTALGYKSEHFMLDLPEVIHFQTKYLQEVRRVTGLNVFMMQSTRKEYDFICSFYALGEFDNETKEKYKPIIQAAKHGYIAFNPHSGASDDLSLFKHDIKVTPGIEPGIRIIEW